MTCKSCGSGWHTVEQVAHGVVGLAKVATRIERSPDDLVRERLNACKGCDLLRRIVVGIDKRADVGLFDSCDECGCVVRAKVLIETERCPHGKW